MKGLLVILAVVAFVGAAAPPACHEPSDAEGTLHFPNPDDCTTFYVCNSAHAPILMKCRPGTWFHPDKRVCDWPANIPEGVCVPPPQ